MKFSTTSLFSLGVFLTTKVVTSLPIDTRVALRSSAASTPDLAPVTQIVMGPGDDEDEDMEKRRLGMGGMGGAGAALGNLVVGIIDGVKQDKEVGFRFCPSASRFGIDTCLAF